MRELGKTVAKALIQPRRIDRLLLAWPWLYRTRIVRYESTLIAGGGWDELRYNLLRVVDLPGDIVEFGSHRCGTSILMARCLADRGSDKKVYALDSFQGFDRDELRSEKLTGRSTAHDDAFTQTTYAYVQRKLDRLGIASVIPICGFFKDTATLLTGPVCLALVDCDLSESMTFCAETVWTRLVPGGRLLFDDYNSAKYKGARQAVDTFVERHRADIEEHGLRRRLYLVSKRGRASSLAEQREDTGVDV